MGFINNVTHHKGANIYNLFSCYINYNPTSSSDAKYAMFDKSNTTVFNQYTRDSDNFDSGKVFTFKAPEETNYNELQLMYNPDYKQRNFPQLKANYCEATQMGAQGVWATKKENSELMKCLTWAKYPCLNEDYVLDDDGSYALDGETGGLILDE